MTSTAQLTANRANAAHSTGPKSDAGKLASSRNSLRHGLTAKKVVIPGEDAAEYDALRQELHADFAPANTAEATLVDQIAEHTWRLQRVRRAETAAFEGFMRNKKHTDFVVAFAMNDSMSMLEKIRRYEVTIERSYHRAVDQLRKLQKERRHQEKEASKLRIGVRQPAAATGFVSHYAAQSAAVGFVSQSLASSQTSPALCEPTVQSRPCSSNSSAVTSSTPISS